MPPKSTIYAHGHNITDEQEKDSARGLSNLFAEMALSHPFLEICFFKKSVLTSNKKAGSQA